MTEFLYWSAARLAEALRRRELSALEVTEAHLARIEAVNPVINAVVQVASERALDEARRADRLAAGGRFAGPLHGVPITLKDSLDTEGIVSTGGTRGREHHVPGTDATVVARLRAAGAIVLGKSNTPELTLSGETDNLIYGRTNNPYDPGRTPGGSSGGAAAIIAAGGAPLDLGSDTGGSIREPAHFCGIAGIKPTSGRVPRTGHVVPHGLGAIDSLTQIGPMARYVADLSLALPIISGPDWVDPHVVPVPLGRPDDVDLRSLRVAFYTDNGLVVPNDAIVEAVRDAARVLRDDGLRVAEAAPEALSRAGTLFGEFRLADGGSIARRLLARVGTETPGPHMAYCFQGPPPVGADEYTALLEEVDEVRSRMRGFLRDHDVILCPPSRHCAPPHGAAQETYEQWSHETVYNLTGWPGAVVRAGEDASGLPIGVQIVAGPWREDVCLAVAARLEAALGGYRRPPL